MIPLENFLILSSILFCIGFYGVLSRKNAILILISVELMLAAVGINFVAFSSFYDTERYSGHIFALFIVAIAAAEVGLALGIIIRLFRERKTINIDEANELKW
jgi:NADH:ubiquinone oxidoreductase subunit K